MGSEMCIRDRLTVMSPAIFVCLKNCPLLQSCAVTPVAESIVEYLCCIPLWNFASSSTVKSPSTDTAVFELPNLTGLIDEPVLPILTCPFPIP